MAGDPAPRVAEATLRHTTARLAVWTHATVLLIALVVGGDLARPEDSAAFAVAMIVLTGWTAVFSAVVLRRGLSAPVVAGDTVVTAVLSLSLGRLVPPATVESGSTWVAPLTACTLLAIALALPPAPSIALGAVVTGCYVTGANLAGQLHAGFAQAWICAIQVAVMVTVMWHIRRAAVSADRQFAAEEELAFAAEVDATRRAEERAALRTIHGTALATLTMIGAGAVAGSSSTVRRWAADDLRVLRAMADRERHVPDLQRLDRYLVDLLTRHRGQLRITFDPTPCRAPPDVVRALSDAAAEAVANAARHSGTDEVTLTLHQTGDTITLRVDDRGRGVEPGVVPGRGFGIRESIVGAVEAVGGRARMESVAGAGCLWTLQWPAEPATEPLPTSVAAHFERGALYAALTVAALWHVLNDLAGVIVHFGDYRPGTGGPLSAGLWWAYSVIGAWAAYQVLRDRPARPWFTGPAAAVLLAGVALNVAVCTGPGVEVWRLVFGNADWAVGVSGWIGILVFWHDRRRLLLALFAGNLLAELGALEVLAPLDGQRLAQWLAAGYAITTLQIVFVVGLRFLQRHGDRAALSVQRQNRALAARAAANAVHADRRRRYTDFGADAAGLLAELADGRADPAAAATRHRASVEAAKLRRLLAERDDVTDRLLHELRACADVAGRRGVAVDLVTVGTLPLLTLEARRTLTQAPARLLATARSWARVTVVTTAEEVTVGVVVDGVLSTGHLGGTAEVQIDDERGGLWLESIWPRSG